MNTLYCGDNLDVMRKFIRDETVDLCYIDPPFNSKRYYNQIYNNIGTEDRAQAQAFTDTWTWDDHANQCYDEILSNKNGVQTQQSIALINGLQKVRGLALIKTIRHRPGFLPSQTVSDKFRARIPGGTAK